MQGENFLLLAVTAQRFGCRPSKMVCLRDPVVALDFDLAAAARLLDMERAAVDRMSPGSDEDHLASPPREVRW